MPNLGMSPIAGFAYAFIMTAAAEELVMRGLLYKLIPWMVWLFSRQSVADDYLCGAAQCDHPIRGRRSSSCDAPHYFFINLFVFSMC